jgi:hypothetical protein
LISGQQPIDDRLLMLLLTSYAREVPLQFLVHPGTSVAEAQALGFDAIHQNDAHTRERVHVQLTDRFWHQVLPGEMLPVERRPFIVQQVDGHEDSLGKKM